MKINITPAGTENPGEIEVTIIRNGKTEIYICKNEDGQTVLPDDVPVELEEILYLLIELYLN